jgi:hypothetical protein
VGYLLMDYREDEGILSIGRKKNEQVWGMSPYMFTPLA